MASHYKDNGHLLNELTGAIQKQLQTLVYEIGLDDQPAKLNTFQIKIPALKRALLVLPGMAGWMLHWPLYISLKQLIVKKALPLGHFDSIMVGLLLVAYPCYLVLCTLVLQRFLGSYWGLLPFFVMPFFAWCYVQIKKQAD
jgi:hypothetical protein